MKIESVDLFYLALPRVRVIGDGSQDTLLVRVRSGNHEGWGECEASPLTSIASFVCPLSHSACRPVGDSVLGQRLDSPKDIARIGHLIRANSFDLLQAEHTISGIDVAMWDLLGRRAGKPVHQLLGDRKAYPKLAYASALFGETPEQTFGKVRQFVRQGFRAVKLGWGSFGRHGLRHDRAQVEAAREAAGPVCRLMIDAGTIWGADVASARARLAFLKRARVTWLEEPFATHQHEAYLRLAKSRPRVPLAGGEGAHNAPMAMHMIDHAGLSYVQIDAGRVGGISAARQVVDHARRRQVQYVNHTFTSNLALSASLQPYAGVRPFDICEYPVELSELAAGLTVGRIVPDADGRVAVPEGPGLGVDVNRQTVRRFLQRVVIKVGGRILYESPSI